MRWSGDWWNLIIGFLFYEFEINDFLADVIEMFHSILYRLEIEVVIEKGSDIEFIDKRIFEGLIMLVSLHVRERGVSILFEEIFYGVLEYCPEIGFERLIFLKWFYAFPEFYIEVGDNIFGILFADEIIRIDITEKHIDRLQVELVEGVLILFFQFLYVLLIKHYHKRCITG